MNQSYKPLASLPLDPGGLFPPTNLAEHLRGKPDKFVALADSDTPEALPALVHLGTSEGATRQLGLEKSSPAQSWP